MPAPEDQPTLDVLATGAVTTGAATPGSVPRRFEPGAIIAGRYRLVALLGRGGMGEVYRADDLTLDQPVALKFLAQGVAADEARLSQFHNELRIARQVSHKNVCRLYDLGDADGRRFLTMEYVDGEDMASLLRRIGRVPQDRAVQMARQLCAAVAAAHERGVLHRDLKPANVMIDGEGNVRITDFGIATAAGRTDDGFAGTPQYMAPEQLTGRPASTATDVYALGLILFELFTGRRAVDSKTLGELRQFHQTGTLPTPSSIVRDLDPAVERVILRCLERDPARRPPSALTVAAALPGGDPLAAALAAGETPSPEILAAAGESEALGVVRGILLVAAVAAGLLAFAAGSQRTSLVTRTPLDEPPDVLVDRAEQVIAAVGYADVAGDTAHGLMGNDDYTDWLRNSPPNPRRWDVIATGNPSGVLFWYRSSPNDLLPVEDAAVTLTDPPATNTGMRTVVLDPRGRLLKFHSMPPRFDEDTTPAAPPPWAAMFEAAGLQMSAFTATTPQWTPDAYADARAAWEGPMPQRADVQLRVEAAGYRGRPVSFEVIGPWTSRERVEVEFPSTVDRVFLALVLTALAFLIVAAAVLAWRHLRANRADRRGAARVTLYLAAAGLVSWAVRADHASAVVGEVDLFIRSAGPLTLIGAIFWIVYIALEPYVRKFWPDALLGWSRLLAGHVRDPRVGHDVLIGLAFGVAIALIILGKATILPALGYSAAYPGVGHATQVIGSTGSVVWGWLLESLGALGAALFAVLTIVMLRLAVRSHWLALGITSFLLSVTNVNDVGSGWPWSLLFPISSGILLTLVAVRFGLLALVVAEFASGILVAIPLTLEVSHWSATVSNWTLAGLLALACFGFYASRAGQPLFGTILKE